jgi:hypothetical protein
MLSLNREKRGHFNRLRAASHLEADIALLKKIDPRHPLIEKPSGKDQKYADDVLYALLLLACDCDIVDWRRGFAKKKLLDYQVEILQQRFAEYIASADPEDYVDPEDMIRVISEELTALVITHNIPGETAPFAEHLEIISSDNEHFTIQLTAEAIEAIRESERLAEEQKEAERKRIEAERLKKEQEEAERKKLEADAAALTEKEAVLDEKESELMDKESDLDDKETDLSGKEEQLAEKEALLAVKAAELEDKAELEKKSEPKKKSTPK